MLKVAHYQKISEQVAALELERDDLKQLACDVIGFIIVNRDRGTLTSVDEKDLDRLMDVFTLRYGQAIGTVPRPQTIDEQCGQPPGSFKKFAKKKEGVLLRLERERKRRIKDARK